MLDVTYAQHFGGLEDGRVDSSLLLGATRVEDGGLYFGADRSLPLLLGVCINLTACELHRRQVALIALVLT